jgi:hypothetical protein
MRKDSVSDSTSPEDEMEWISRHKVVHRVLFDNRMVVRRR